MRVAIIDYRMGNIKSVYNAVKYLGYDAIVVDGPEDAWGSKLIIPGVGAFMNGVKNLKVFTPSIKRHLDSGLPLLGICLGLQIFFERSEENPEVNGLGIVRGRVVKIETQYKLPHIGWNLVRVEDNRCPLFNELDSGFAYFIHSYHAVPEEPIVVATTDYGCRVTAAVWKDNIFGTQFHPERSGKFGLKILKNFLEL